MKTTESSGTRIVGLMGYPVEHSLSPIMHNAAFCHLKIPFSYHLFSVRTHELKRAVEAMKILNIVGLNVTIPHKVEVIKYLDKIDRDAQIIGAVNTILNRRGKLIGYNTDGEGFLTSLLEEFRCSLNGKSCLVMGAGGAGRAVVVKMLKRKVKKLFIADKMDNKARRLVQYLRKKFPLIHIEFIPWQKRKLDEILKGIDILVNATPCGMHKNDREPVVDISPLKKGTFVYDVIYNRPTPLINASRKKGLKARGGLGMLIHQGACAFKIWTGRNAPTEVMRDALKKYIKKGF